ncbi:MAG TPA: hypothetical protein PK199_08440 [Bacteroidales bacterium]|nr:hypothetical protein [Bacteroidales bacterium]
MKNSYKILSDEKIIVETYSGNFSLLSFITLKRKEANDPLYNNTYDYIIDFSEVYFPDYQKYQDIVYFIELYADKIELKKCALITRNPNQVVESVLFSMEAEKLLPIAFKVFSSFKSAYSWIKFIPISSDVNFLQNKTEE